MYFRKNITRILFFILGLFIAIGTLFYTSNLFKKLANEEKQKVNLFAKALNNVGAPESSELMLYWSVLQLNKDVPILIFDEKDNLIQYKNVSFSPKEKKLPKELLIEKKHMHSTPIEINLGKNTTQYVYYGYSETLYQLRYMPIVQLFLIIIFIITGYIIYSSVQNANQNSLWVGLSKETAHQMGTPISSLIAWLDLIKEQKIAPYYLPEMEKDVKRLKVVSDRFSHIGSAPTKQCQDIIPLIEETINYMNSRTSKSIEITSVNDQNKGIPLEVNKELFIWVIENLIKNGADAIVRKGKITITTTDYGDKVCIDVADTGKGIPAKALNRIFRPGYTSKKRGWGLGLSLSKRIIKDYHNGRIFVKNSEPNKGTTFRIILQKI